ncbi:ABC transporter permease, partial [Mesorhizobium sp. M00.F.Ca.ET.216.01.1.1]
MSDNIVRYCPRGRARAIKGFLRQFLSYGGAQVGLVCLVF